MAEVDPRSQSPSRRQKQLSIRSDRAVTRAKQIAHSSGWSVTQVVERALDQLSPEDKSVPEGMARKGKLLVIKSTGSGPKTNEDAAHLIDMLRIDWADE